MFTPQKKACWNELQCSSTVIYIYANIDWNYDESVDIMYQERERIWELHLKRPSFLDDLDSLPLTFNSEIPPMSQKKLNIIYTEKRLV